MTPAPEISDKELALRYAGWVWDCTILEQERIVPIAMGSNIHDRLDWRLRDKATLTNAQIAAIKAWQEDFKSRLEWLTSSNYFLTLQDHGEAIIKAYQISRARKSAFIHERPTYNINVTESDVRIEIQREFDISREAEVLSHPTLSPTELLQLRHGSDRTYYDSCGFMPPELSVAAELAAIRGAGEMVHVKKVWDWLPGDIAALAGVGTDGRPLDGEDPWKFYYTVSGYRRIEDAYSLGGVFRGIPPAELSKYVF